MSKVVTFDIHGAGEEALTVAAEAVATAGVEVVRAATMSFPVRKAQLSVEGSSPDVDAAYEAVIAAFPDNRVTFREKEHPWHWEHRS